MVRAFGFSVFHDKAIIQPFLPSWIRVELMNMVILCHVSVEIVSLWTIESNYRFQLVDVPMHVSYVCRTLAHGKGAPSFFVKLFSL